MSDDPGIAAVFATMNRAETAVLCVEALAAQTIPPTLVVVTDNASSDDTFQRLRSLVDLPFEFVVHRLPENIGNAGGVRDAMEIAFDKAGIKRVVGRFLVAADQADDVPF